MSAQPQIPGLFSAQSLDNDPQPATPKQIAYAERLASRRGVRLPTSLLKDRAGLSAWIEVHTKHAANNLFDNYPSSKQVAFAERIARVKRREIPQACFRDRKMMSRWIDCNQPR
ncbi:MAG: hypothetical protein AAF636_09435 [Pseudomonadota bacterium]